MNVRNESNENLPKGQESAKKLFRIVKLEERIAPKTIQDIESDAFAGGYPLIVRDGLWQH